MKKITFSLLLISSLLSFSLCATKGKRNSSENTFVVDTTKSFKIDKFWVTPKLSLNFNSLIKSSKDTLTLVICSEYVYSPFGIIKDKTDLKSSLLRNLNVENKEVENTEFQVLKLNSNKLITFFDNDPEATKKSYVIKGELHDNSISLVDNVKIGMSVKDFYKTFFDLFPKELHSSYSVIILESCVTDIRHIYNFNSGKLSSIKFECVECKWHISY